MAHADDKADALNALLDAYPKFLRSYDATSLVWRDGTRTPIGDGVTKSARELLESPDLIDQFHYIYPVGESDRPLTLDQDPGRVRYPPLFRKMYGNCERGDVERDLVSVPWLPSQGGKAVRFTKENGAAEALKAVSADLDKLPRSMTRFLIPTAGTYNCRVIAGTNEQSAHSFGIAIDLNTAYADYWRWSGIGKYTNRIPIEIVSIFERHGFIWGGKWYHYDTMHFEFRPELINFSRTHQQ